MTTINRTATLDQAKSVASLLPAIMRSLFAAEDDPAAELPLSQLRVCGVLAGGPRPMSAIGRELRVSLSAMTQVADRLEAAGLVQRIAEENDRRIHCLQLTPRGERIMRLREDGRVRRVFAVLDRLAPEMRDDILTALEMLLEACANSRNERSDGQHFSPSEPNVASLSGQRTRGEEVVL